MLGDDGIDNSERHIAQIASGRFSRIAIIAANMLPLFLAIFSFFRRSVTRMNSAVVIMVFIAFLNFLRITRSHNKKDRSPDWCLSEFCQIINGWSCFVIYRTILILYCSQTPSRQHFKRKSRPTPRGGTADEISA